MRTTRALVLKRERLTELAVGDLREIVGADPAAPTMPVKYCVTAVLTCYDTCASWHTEAC
jgi:hypothetical protein